MSISKWLDQSLDVPLRHYDVVIIGAGIAGLSCAFWLQKKDSHLKIAIVEKRRLGFGASGRNAGFVTCGSVEHFMKLQNDFGPARAVEIWKFSEENHRLLVEEIIHDQGSLFDYRRTGSCTVAPSEERWEKYRFVLQTMQASGIDVHSVTSAEMENDYGVQGFAGGVHYTGDGYIDPMKLMAELRRRLRVDLVEGAEVFAIEGAGPVNGAASATKLVRSDQGNLAADKVIVTVNAYLPLVLPNFRGLVTPGRGQILMTEPLPPFVKGPCYLTKHLAYFRQLPSGELIVGGFRNLAKEIESTYADETTPLIQQALREFVRTHFKSAATAKINYQWAGIMGFTPDGQMLLGEVAPGCQIYVMAGCSGHGLGLSFHAAKKLIENLGGAQLPSYLDLQRYADRVQSLS